MPNPLRFHGDGTFTIAVITDIHWQNGGEEDGRSAVLLDAVLEAEQPDLVVINGDLIHGGGCDDPARSWRDAMQPVLDRRLPWAAVFGNHDDEGSLSRAQLMDMQQPLPGCLSEPGPASIAGIGNYCLPVLAAVGDKPAANLYFLDSHSYARSTIGGYDWIKQDQVAWYAQTAKDLHAGKSGDPLPALAFCHIPLPEFNEVWNYHTCYGVKGETICAPLINTGLFAAMVEAGDVMGLFVGHDHYNDFIGELHGIRLAFGRTTGYGGYGSEDFAKGARMLRLGEGARDFETWLRLEDGEVITKQPKHAPGMDQQQCLPSDYA